MKTLKTIRPFGFYSPAGNLRQSMVNRWGIVGTTRDQSVAEHQFNVAMMAVSVHAYLVQNCTRPVYEDVNHPDLALRDLLVHALTHDGLEIYKGDTPTVAKKHGIDDDKEQEELMFATLGGIYDLRNPITASLTDDVIKFCDILESVTWLSQYGDSSAHTAEVLDGLQSRIIEYTRKMDEAWAEFDWNGALKACGDSNSTAATSLTDVLQAVESSYDPS